MPTLTPVDQPEFLTAVHYVAARIRESGWNPDFIIGIGRGGLIPAVYLSHATGVPMLSVDHSSALPDFAAELLVKLAGRSLTDRLLFVDDINDSGSTITHVKAALHEAVPLRQCTDLVKPRRQHAAKGSTLPPSHFGKGSKEFGKAGNDRGFRPASLLFRLLGLADLHHAFERQ